MVDITNFTAMAIASIDKHVGRDIFYRGIGIWLVVLGIYFTVLGVMDRKILKMQNIMSAVSIIFGVIIIAMNGGV